MIICLQTVLWFHVFLSNTNNFEMIYLTRPIDWILTGTAILSQSGPGSNNKAGVIQTPQILNKLLLTSSFLHSDNSDCVSICGF